MQTLTDLFIFFFLALSKCADIIIWYFLLLPIGRPLLCVDGLLTSCCKPDETTFSAARSVCAVSAVCL